CACGRAGKRKHNLHSPFWGARNANAQWTRSSAREYLELMEVGMSMNIVSLVRASLLGLALMLANTSPAVGQGQPAGGQGQRTLYERLGGYTAISAVVNDFADRLVADPKICKEFFRTGTETPEMFKQKKKKPCGEVNREPYKENNR